ncbi:MAG: GNAT family N-acetyltransferase [Thaumarchaeota archaeon]|nr:GNAT family N-acetyltransferase [Nitrososphaerota archaeon]
MERIQRSTTESPEERPAGIRQLLRGRRKIHRGQMEKKNPECAVALSDDRPVGMIAYVFDTGLKTRHIAEIYGFYVSAAHRGEGVGTRLLEQALSLIRKKKGIVKARLYVNTEQRAAVNLYKKAGFVVRGKIKKELKVGRRFFDMLILEKMF